MWAALTYRMEFQKEGKEETPAVCHHSSLCFLAECCMTRPSRSCCYAFPAVMDRTLPLNLKLKRTHFLSLTALARYFVIKMSNYYKFNENIAFSSC